jgi:hypothetical protein
MFSPGIWWCIHFRRVEGGIRAWFYTCVWPKCHRGANGLDSRSWMECLLTPGAPQISNCQQMHSEESPEKATSFSFWAILQVVAFDPASTVAWEASGLKLHKLRVPLRLNDKLGSQQALLLILRRMRPIHNIGNKLRAKRKIEVVAVDV